MVELSGKTDASSRDEDASDSTAADRAADEDASRGGESDRVEKFTIKARTPTKTAIAASPTRSGRFADFDSKREATLDDVPLAEVLFLVRFLFAIARKS